jgi:hypothetical protein
MRLTHVINPVNCTPDSELGKAQRIAHESIRRAREYARAMCPGLEVELVAAVHEQDRPAIPAGTDAVGLLTRSLLDATTIRPAKPLPLIGDIYTVAHTHGTGSHVIYSNADIGFAPAFYEIVARLLKDRPAFGITRRNIDKTLTDPADLPLAAAAAGEAFRGIDVFVSPREDIPSYDLQAAVIGLPTVEYGLLAAMDAACGFRCTVHYDLCCAFHHGNDRVWSGPTGQALADFNDDQARRILVEIEKRYPQIAGDSLAAFYAAKMRQRGAKNNGLWRRILHKLGKRSLARPAPWQT